MTVLSGSYYYRLAGLSFALAMLVLIAVLGFAGRAKQAYGRVRGAAS